MTPLRRTTALLTAAALAAGAPAGPPAAAEPGRASRPASSVASFDDKDPNRFIYHQYMTLGRRAAETGRVADCREYYAYAMDLAGRFRPKEHHPFEDLGDALAEAGQMPEAAYGYVEAIRIVRGQGVSGNDEIVERLQRKLGGLPESARRSPRPLPVVPRTKPEEVAVRRPDYDEDEDAAKEEMPAFMDRRPLPRVQRPTAFEPRPRRAGPLIDFAHTEMNVFAGGLGFSGKFLADPSGCGGALLRAPAPGLPIRDAGVFGELVFSGMDRNITPSPPDDSGMIFFLAGGGDYTFQRDEETVLLGQAGLVYANFGGITDLDDGFGAIAGVLGGFNIDSGFWITYNPQVAFATTGDWIVFHHFGMHIEF